MCEAFGEVKQAECLLPAFWLSLEVGNHLIFFPNKIDKLFEESKSSWYAVVVFFLVLFSFCNLWQEGSGFTERNQLGHS